MSLMPLSEFFVELLGFLQRPLPVPSAAGSVGAHFWFLRTSAVTKEAGRCL